MRVTEVPFNLREWRHRLGLTQAQAAELVGMSESGYKRAEYRSTDRLGDPCNKTLALLATRVEQERSSKEMSHE